LRADVLNKTFEGPKTGIHDLWQHQGKKYTVKTWFIVAERRNEYLFHPFRVGNYFHLTIA